MDIDDLLKNLANQQSKISALMKKPPKSDSIREYFIKLISLAAKGTEYFQSIQMELMKSNNVTFTPKPVNLDLFRDIRENGSSNITSVKIYQAYLDMLKKDNNLSFGDEQLYSTDTISANLDDLFEEFSSWFNALEYYQKRLEIGVIISSKLPKDYIKYFNEIREAFAFKLYRSSIVLCRALLERLFIDLLKVSPEYQDQLKLEKHRLRGEKYLRLCDNIHFAYTHCRIDDIAKSMSLLVKNTANDIMHDMEFLYFDGQQKKS